MSVVCFTEVQHAAYYGRQLYHVYYRPPETVQNLYRFRNPRMWRQNTHDSWAWCRIRPGIPEPVNKLLFFSQATCSLPCVLITLMGWPSLITIPVSIYRNHWITVTNGLSFEPHANNIVSKTRQRLSTLISFVASFPATSVQRGKPLLLTSIQY